MLLDIWDELSRQKRGWIQPKLSSLNVLQSMSCCCFVAVHPIYILMSRHEWMSPCWRRHLAFKFSFRALLLHKWCTKDLADCAGSCMCVCDFFFLGGGLVGLSFYCFFSRFYWFMVHFMAWYLVKCFQANFYFLVFTLNGIFRTENGWMAPLTSSPLLYFSSKCIRKSTWTDSFSRRLFLKINSLVTIFKHDVTSLFLQASGTEEQHLIVS